MAELAKYRAIRRGHNGIQPIEPGVVFTFEGVPGSWMEPVNGPAEKAMKEYQDSRKKGAPPPPPDIPPAPSPPRLIKSHPDLPNPEGSSGEEEGDEVPFAAVKRQERKLAAEQSDATREARAGRGRAATGRRRGTRRKVKRRAAKPADSKAPRPQSDPFASADDAGTT